MFNVSGLREKIGRVTRPDTDPDGNITGYYYDNIGRVELIKNYTENQWTQYSYDSINRKTLEIYPNGIFTNYSYSSCACGNQILNTLYYQPTDNFNRVNSTNIGGNWTEAAGDWSISSNQLYIDQQTTFQIAVYTAGGNVSNPTVECSMVMHNTYTNVNGFLIFGYSDVNNYYYAGADAHGTTFVIGHVTQGTYSNQTKVSGPVYGEILYRLRATVSGSTVSLYWLNNDGVQPKVSYVYGSNVPSGKTGVLSAFACTSFDDFILSNNTTVIAKYTYDYDLAGNRTDMFDLSTSTTYYFYDSLNRLTTECRYGHETYTRGYSYDSVGNRLTMNNGGTVTNYVYNNLTDYQHHWRSRNIP